MENVPINISAAIERFNPAQKEAATTTDGPMLVIAGAGSGKTSVLTSRIAILMAKGVRPERILALTFTKKAAEEMRDRIIALQGDEARKICMGTFHSVFIRFLRPYSERIGFPENFTIMDEDDSLSTLKKCIQSIIAPTRPPKEKWTEAMEKKFAEEDKFYKPKTIQGIISLSKNELIDADKYWHDRTYYETDLAARRPLTRNIFRAYRDSCKLQAVMDFDDILLYTDKLLEENPDVLAMISGSFDYILVDEFQDTNTAQYSILKRLTWINKNLCVVGDDSQSIYAFRGAKIENILSLGADFPGCKVVKLQQNYRSTKMIVNAANNLIERNETRIPKVCFSDARKGDPIILKTTKNEKEEAYYIADKIREKIRLGGMKYGDFAVLYRTNAQSLALEDAMVKAKIPYSIFSGISFFSRAEIKDLMAYFRLAVNPRDNEAFLRVVNKPKRGFGESAQKKLEEIASYWNMSLYDAASNPSIYMCGFPPKALRGLENFIENINECIGVAATMTADEAARHISDATGFYEDLIVENTEESLRKADNLRELVDSVSTYEEDIKKQNEGLDEDKMEKPILAGYLQNIMLLSNADTSESDEGKVSMMTVHCAKGLEYGTVFIAGMSENLFPLCIEKTKKEEEEERRLFYVAMTRAKNELILSRSETRMRFGKREYMKPSRFLTELRTKLKP